MATEHVRAANIGSGTAGYTVAAALGTKRILSAGKDRRAAAK